MLLRLTTTLLPSEVALAGQLALLFWHPSPELEAICTISYLGVDIKRKVLSSSVGIG